MIYFGFVSFTSWIPSWFCLLFFFCLHLCSLFQESCAAAIHYWKRVWTLQCRDVSCWLPWCGTSGCVGWWIDGGMWQVTVEFCLPVSCSDSTYGLTSFPSCQFLKNTQEFGLSFQFLWSTWTKIPGGEKYINIKKNPNTSSKKPIILIQKM